MIKKAKLKFGFFYNLMTSSKLSDTLKEYFFEQFSQLCIHINCFSSILNFHTNIGFYPQLFHIYLFNSSITIGIAFGLFIIIFSIFLTLIYVLISNLYLDKIREIND